MLGGLFGFEAGSSAYASPGHPAGDGFADPGRRRTSARDRRRRGRAGACDRAWLPNVPQLFGYREYRRAPEPPIWLRWRPNVAWALLSALALAISLFGMWQRLEFLYFQF